MTPANIRLQTTLIQGIDTLEVQDPRTNEFVKAATIKDYYPTAIFQDSEGRFRAEIGGFELRSKQGESRQDFATAVARLWLRCAYPNSKHVAKNPTHNQYTLL